MPAPATTDTSRESHPVQSGTPALPIRTFDYDYENRLLEHNIASVGVTVEHAYDGLGRLVKTVRAVSGGATTNYVRASPSICDDGTICIGAIGPRSP